MVSGVTTLRLTYTGFTVPDRGALVEVNGSLNRFGVDGLFRVKNKPKVMDDGSFALDLERVED